MIHYLRGGDPTSACGLTDEEMKGRRWTNDPRGVTCLHCLKAMNKDHEPRADMTPSGFKDETKPTGTKRDRDKTRFDLIPHEFEESLARVLTFGAQTYGPNNWRMMEDLGRFVAAYRRHVNAWQKGEILDPETNEPHLVHAICNLMFIAEIQRNGARQAAMIHNMPGKEKS